MRLGDVARAEIGLRQYIVDSQLNGEPATFIAIYQQPGANGLVVSNAVRKALEEMKSRFPEGLDYAIALDTNDFVRLSIEEVIKTLAEAMVLVVLVVYLFLQSFRTTLICAVAIVVALVATFSGMLALGFSINLLTLFGLILAIGMVVDDAIVVCENVERNMQQHHLGAQGGDHPLDGRDRQLAGRRGAGDGLGVHPGGLPARHHRPALQAVRHHHRHLGGGLRLRRADADAGDVRAAAQAQRRRRSAASSPGSTGRSTASRAASAMRWNSSSSAWWWPSCCWRVFLWAIWHLFHLLPTSFVPQEDQGYAMVAIIMPQAASLERTQAVAERVDAILAKIPGVDKRSMITGYSLVDGGFKTNAATFFITFKHFKERYAIDRHRQGAERARHPDGLLRPGQAHRARRW